VLIEQKNIGKIAERIVMNEFEARGFRATDLNKDGSSPNADIMIAKGGRLWQIQVKGSANKANERWWLGYGWADQEMIDDRSKPAFNKRADAFYVASHVVFVAVRSPSDYRCFVVPVGEAQRAVQYNLDGYFRLPKVDGGVRRPGKISVYLDPAGKVSPREERTVVERQMLLAWEGHWDLN